ncbi:MAG: MerR family transcriptional regulator [Gemmatimonadetes bacterium]|nr:MerR family transcriptional regulator [Gemmatimonadota bacterium]
MIRLTIGQVARRADVGVETVRFYERQGLVPEPPRSASGYRQYPEETIVRLHFIQRAKELGFSLREVEVLISLRFESSACASDVKNRAEEKVRDIDDRIRDLQRMRQSLSQLVAACTGRGSTAECSILGALEGTQP